MRTIASRLDTRAGKHTHEQINRLVDHITGQLSDTSFFFLHDVCAKNPDALEKFNTKCQQLKLVLKAEDINRVIDSLQKQIHLPQHILETIQYYLLDKRTNSIANVLNTVSNKLVADTYSTDMILQASMHVMNNLNLLINSNQEEAFLRSIVTMMINFQSKEHHATKTHNLRKRTADDASKWLRTLLALSDKSDLSKLIDLIADRLQLGDNVISGSNRNMDFTELFFLFEEMAIQADISVIHESNKKLMLDINAIMLTTLVCKKAPVAFFDVVALQQHSKQLPILQLMQQYYQTPLVLYQFFNDKNFQHYFRQHGSTNEINQQAFLLSFATYLHDLGFHAHDKTDIHFQHLFQFLDLCHKQDHEMSDLEFVTWFERTLPEYNVEENIQATLFNAIERELELNNHRSGSLVFVANKLVSMGFSPRSASVATTGFFQPLITTNIRHTDALNLAALKKFYDQLKPKPQRQLIKELLLSSLIRYRKMPSKQSELIENQQKLLGKRPADNMYPIPTLHHFNRPKASKAAKAAKTPRIIRKKPTYPNTFFNETTHKSKPIKPSFKFTMRH